MLLIAVLLFVRVVLQDIMPLHHTHANLVLLDATIVLEVLKI